MISDKLRSLISQFRHRTRPTLRSIDIDIKTRELLQIFGNDIPAWFVELFLTTPFGNNYVKNNHLSKKIHGLCGDAIRILDASEILEELQCYEDGRPFIVNKCVPIMRGYHFVGDRSICIPDPICIVFNANTDDPGVISVSHESGPSIEGDIQICTRLSDFLKLYSHD